MEKKDSGQNTFGDLLREFRIGNGLSQTGLAKQSGLDSAYISRVERGIYNPPKLSTIVRLSDTLELSDEDKARLLNASGRNIKSFNFKKNVKLEDFIWDNLLTMASRARSVGRVDIAQILIEATAALGKLETNPSSTATPPQEIQN